MHCRLYYISDSCMIMKRLDTTSTVLYCKLVNEDEKTIYTPLHVHLIVAKEPIS